MSNLGLKIRIFFLNGCNVSSSICLTSLKIVCTRHDFQPVFLKVIIFNRKQFWGDNREVQLHVTRANTWTWTSENCVVKVVRSKHTWSYHICSRRVQTCRRHTWARKALSGDVTSKQHFFGRSCSCVNLANMLAQNSSRYHQVCCWIPV